MRPRPTAGAVHSNRRLRVEVQHHIDFPLARSEFAMFHSVNLYVFVKR
jgi:hypothetical protein